MHILKILPTKLFHYAVLSIYICTYIWTALSNYIALISMYVEGKKLTSIVTNVLICISLGGRSTFINYICTYSLAPL